MVKVISFVLNHAGALRTAAFAYSMILLVPSLSGNISPEAVSGGEVSPSPRIHFGMAYDAESDRIILFGGTSEGEGVGDLYDDTWSYDLNLNTWTDMNPAEAPSPRSDFAMAYDAESDRVVAFGGDPLSDKTWAYDYNTNTWRNMSPVTRPSAGAGPMAYDAESDRVVLFLAWTGAPDNETWTYDFNSNTWTKMEPTTRPSPRTFSAMAYDAESDRVILFGGITGGDNDETWAYDFNTNTWTKMEPAARPSPRHSHALAYDAESDRVVLFGGHLPGFPQQVHSDETWAYDFNTNTWTRMEPPTQPLKLAHHNLAYDAESDRVVLFGGDDPDSSVHSDETWAYDLNANTWTDLSPVRSPSEAQNLQAEAGDARVLLTWSPPSDDGGSTITAYRIYRGTRSGDLGLARLAEVDVALTYVDHVTSDVTYYYQVSAVNGIGEGARSNETSATPEPGAQFSPMTVVITAAVTAVAAILAAVIVWTRRSQRKGGKAR